MVKLTSLAPPQTFKKRHQDVALKTNNPDAKVMADTLSTAVGAAMRRPSEFCWWMFIVEYAGAKKSGAKG